MGSRTAFTLAAVLLAVAVLLHYTFRRAPHTIPVVTITSTMTTPPTSMATSTSLTLSSPAFVDNGPIPARYTCDGRGDSPALEWSGVPEGTKSLALIVEDPDVPKALMPSGVFTHWVLYGIGPTATGVAEGGVVGNPGENGAGKAAYAPPCPPKGYEPSEHRYIFTIYALDSAAPEYFKVPTKDNIMAMMQGHILAQATYTGRYKRP